MGKDYEYTLAELRDGTGFPADARFVMVRPLANEPGLQGCTCGRNPYGQRTDHHEKCALVTRPDELNCECGASVPGYNDGLTDALEGGPGMSEIQLTYHSDEYARGYRKGYASQ